MKLRTKVVVYVVLIHLLFAAVAVRVLWEDRTWLFVIEGIFALSVVLSIKLTRAIFVPLEMIGTGAELIGERDFTSHFQPIGQSEMDRLIDVYNRMIDQLREERLQVRERNEFLDRLVAASPAGVLTVDLDGRIAEVNPSAERLTGHAGDELIGRSPGEIDGVLAGALAELAVGDSQVVTLTGGRRIRVGRAAFRDRGFERSFFLLEELTEELRQSEKAAYGKLIRMMSHEVNNSVGAVNSLLGSIRSEPEGNGAEPSDELGRAVDIASGRLDNLRAFVDRFADMVRLPPPELRPCDVNRLLDDVLGLVEPSLAERGIDCRRETAVLLPPVELDQNQFEQVLVNLLKNAAEAIDGTGTVTVRTGVDDGRGWFEIEDSGAGIPEAVERQLFTPFFTTKKDGCGLGLTLVKEILSGHGFPFTLENVPGGARFRVELAAPSTERQPTRNQLTRNGPTRNGPTGL